MIKAKNPFEILVGLITATVLSVLVFMVTTTLSRKLGMACESVYCLKEGQAQGLQLFAAILFNALFGHSIFALFSRKHLAAHEFKIATSSAVGMLMLIVYIYARSLINHITVDIPITHWEIFSIILLTPILNLYLHAGKKIIVESTFKINPYTLTINLTIVLSLCIMVAAREMPREIMLSSDPDQHVFFAKQIERFGSIPYHQRDWGTSGFNYPAATGVVIFLWHLLTGIDVRSLLTALAVLFTVMASLIVAEATTSFAKSITKQTIIKLGALALIMGAWNFPHYPEFFHMEGYGRQLSILFSALFISISTSYILAKEEKNNCLYILFGAILFVQTVLNPANIVVPAGFIFFLFVYKLMQGKIDWKLPLSLAFGFSLLMLEPYFQGIMNIVEKARADTVTYSDALFIKSTHQIFNDALFVVTDLWPRTLREISVILFEKTIPLFVPLSLCLGFLLVIIRPSIKPSMRTWVAFSIFLLAFFLVYSFARSLVDDRRFYLLGAYVFFSMAHYKALVLILLSAAMMAAVAHLSYIRFLTIAGLIVSVLLLSVRYEQNLAIDIRKNTCGAYGCIPVEDMEFLDKLQILKSQGKLDLPGVANPKILIPNSINQMGNETWIFPVSSGRLLPHYDILPGAFYYFQGDLEYSTASYAQRVCHNLDRPWLKQKGIHYALLPSHRTGVCIKDMEELLLTEEVVLRSGNAYLIKFKFDD